MPSTVNISIRENLETLNLAVSPLETIVNISIVDGANGKDGADGIIGKDGADGINGQNGQDGIDWSNVSVNGEGQVAGNITLTTDNIPDFLDKRYVTDAELVVISNTSGTNTGDNATNTTSNTYADGKVAQTITNGVTTSAPSQDAVYAAFNNLNIVNLIRQEFTYTSGGFTFTLSDTATAVYGVFVQGQELNSSQFTVVSTTLTILDTLVVADKVNIIYANDTLGINPSYTKNETDTLLGDKVDKVVGKGLSDENYTLTEKNKLGAISGTNTGDNAVISGTKTFDFGNENDGVVETISDASITTTNFLALTVIPTETTETSLDDFKLNGVTFSIENIINNTSFDIRANSINNATGIYTINYKIILN